MDPWMANGPVCNHNAAQKFGATFEIEALHTLHSRALRLGLSYGEVDSAARAMIPVLANSDMATLDRQSSTVFSGKVLEEEMEEESCCKTKRPLNPDVYLPSSSSEDVSGSAESQRARSLKRSTIISHEERRKYRRSPNHVNAEEAERRKQRRLEKNRITAAASRERKRALFGHLQAKVAELQKHNEQLTKKNKKVDSLEKEVQSMQKVVSSLKEASIQNPAQSASTASEHDESTKKSQPSRGMTVDTCLETVGETALLEMPWTLPPGSSLPIKDQKLLCDSRRSSKPTDDYGNWAAMPDGDESNGLNTMDNHDTQQLQPSEQRGLPGLNMELSHYPALAPYWQTPDCNIPFDHKQQASFESIIILDKKASI